MVLCEINYVWLKRNICNMMKPVPRIYYDKTKDQLFIFRLVHTLEVNQIYKKCKFWYLEISLLSRVL